jgi:hypothetical protein
MGFPSAFLLRKPRANDTNYTVFNNEAYRLQKAAVCVESARQRQKIDSQQSAACRVPPLWKTKFKRMPCCFRMI